MGRIVTAREETHCRKCGGVIERGEKMQMDLLTGYNFKPTCLKCLNGPELQEGDSQCSD